MPPWATRRRSLTKSRKVVRPMTDSKAALPFTMFQSGNGGSYAGDFSCSPRSKADLVHCIGATSGRITKEDGLGSVSALPCIGRLLWRSAPARNGSVVTVDRPRQHDQFLGIAAVGTVTLTKPLAKGSTVAGILTSLLESAHGPPRTPRRKLWVQSAQYPARRMFSAPRRRY